MQTFKYNALDQSAKVHKGKLQAQSKSSARQRLRTQGLIPLTLDRITTKRWIIRKKINNTLLLSITRQLSSLSNAGFPLSEILMMISNQMEDRFTKETILSIRNNIEMGDSLSCALQKYPSSFSKLYCAMMAAGEASGRLESVFMQLIHYLEQRERIREAVINALIYPIFLSIISIVMVSYLLVGVMPKMLNAYQSLNQTLPGLTKAMMSISCFFQNDGVYIIIIAVVMSAIFSYYYYKLPSLREKIHQAVLLFPIYKKIAILLDMSRFLRALGMLGGAGVEMLIAIHCALDLVTIIPIKKSLGYSISCIREGNNLETALKQSPYLLGTSLQFIAAGEKTGRLDEMLMMAAQIQDSEATVLIKRSLILLEPMIILLMGVFVLLIVLAVVLPIFQLDQMI